MRYWYWKISCRQGFFQNFLATFHFYYLIVLEPSQSSKQSNSFQNQAFKKYISALKSKQLLNPAYLMSNSNYLFYCSDQLGHQSTAFAWFLRAQMSKMGSDVAIDEETFYVISTAMMAEADGNGLTFKSVIDRCMVSMGSSPEAHGPLFRRIRGLAAPLWLQPPQLRLIATQSIRRSLGPKRLSSNKVMSRLKVPRKIQRFVTLEEKIPTN